MSVDAGIGYQLFRFDDPQVPALQVYVLGKRSANGATSYSYVRDSRWGVWIVEDAFARWFRELSSREDVHPWPVHYDHRTRDFWLPACLKPPAVVERALTLCSGSGPKVVAVNGEHDGAIIRLAREESGAVIGGASLVYTNFAPSKWLCYEWVPQDVASRVATLLGGQIRPFD